MRELPTHLRHTMTGPPWSLLSVAGRHSSVSSVKQLTELLTQSTVLGIPAWILAVLTCFAGSALSVYGFFLQKRGARDPERHYRFGDLVLSWEWVAGFVLLICADFPLAVFAYSLAPMSLIAPLSGVTVVLNMVLAPVLLKEKFCYWPDLPATVSVALGAALTTASGAHEEPVYTPAALWKLFGEPAFLVVLAVDILVVAFATAYMSRKRTELVSSAKRRDANPSVLEMLLPAAVASSCGLLSNINLKAVAVLLRAEGAKHVFPWLMLTALPALLQLNYLNRGLQLYPQTVFIPIYTSTLMVVTTFGGAIFYQEFQMMTQSVCFGLGVALLGCGISLFALRKEDGTSAPLIQAKQQK